MSTSSETNRRLGTRFKSPPACACEGPLLSYDSVAGDRVNDGWYRATRGPKTDWPNSDEEERKKKLTAVS
jgi:hypothetical protein